MMMRMMTATKVLLLVSHCLALSTSPAPSKALLEAQRRVEGGSLCYSKAVRLSRNCRSVDERVAVFRLAAPVLGAAEHLASFALDGLARSGDYGRCKLLLDELVSQYNLKPTAVSYSILLKALAVSGEGRNTTAFIEEDILQEMEKKGIPPDPIFVNALVDTYVRIGSMQKASSLIELVLGDREPVRSLEDQMCELEPSIAAINALLRGLARQGDVILAFDLKRRLSVHGLKPTPRTHAALAMALTTAGKPRLALSRLRAEMAQGAHIHTEEEDQRAWTAAYTALIRSWPSLAESWECLEEMQKNNIKRTAYTYAELLVACRLRISRDAAAREFQVTRAWNAMRKDNIKPSVICYNAAISGYLAGDDFIPTPNAVSLALRLVMELGQERKDRIPVSTLNALVDGLSTTHPQLALRLIPTFQTADSPLASRFEAADIRTWTLALRIHRYDIVKLKETWHQLEKEAIAIDTIALNTYLDALIKCDDHDSAVQVLEDYGQTSTHITDCVSYTTVISGLMNNPRTALRLYDAFRSHSLPDLGLVNAALTACAALRSSHTSSTESNAALRAASRILKDAKAVLSPSDFARATDYARTALVGVAGERGKRRRADSDPLFRRKHWNAFDSGFRIL